MRYPVDNFKTEWNGTAGNPFGVATTYGFHEGVDINDNLGGNSDLGKPLFAIADGELLYYHTAKHPTTTFGYHHVYKIIGSWGTRWVHEAHCQSDLLATVQNVKESQQIAKVGNSGTTYAHCHFSIFKVDPATLPGGIDTIAKTQQQLNDWWEDPIKFIEKYMNVPALPEPNPGYMPTFVGQTVTKNSFTYQSYKDDTGILLWRILPQEDWKTKYEQELERNKVLQGKIDRAKADLA